MLKTNSILGLVAFFFSCNKSNQNSSDIMIQSNWLIGNWECQNEDGILHEKWSKVNNSTFSGQSVFLKGKDTIHNESIVLQQAGEDLIYKTKIQGQNNNDSMVLLKNKSIEDTLKFENVSNDYPQKISYKSISTNQFKMNISGLVDGKLHSEFYLLTKVK